MRAREQEEHPETPLIVPEERPSPSFAVQRRRVSSDGSPGVDERSHHAVGVLLFCCDESEVS